jgi:hypothetical protein
VNDRVPRKRPQLPARSTSLGATNVRSLIPWMAIVPFVAAAPALADRPQPPAATCIASNADGTSDLYAASIVQMLANPERYDGRRVRTFGYIHLEFEGNAIYLHQEDERNSLSANGLWVSLTPGISRHDCNDSYVLVEGTFSASDRGHMGLWNGAVSDITRCLKWPPAGKR